VIRGLGGDLENKSIAKLGFIMYISLRIPAKPLHESLILAGFII
jgi:hypothetical protein